ncbi:hypothetical protein OSB04_005787 [Centaurea solstitialis]|uniref:Uncharacterized protein n=1 Tax=Centaurea solstitialis TaxID=347529 RepID=A0AA38WH39_9ASTR|nr:hypothetical protein OSB04_005787 [Centaurea solstitialis]
MDMPEVIGVDRPSGRRIESESTTGFISDLFVPASANSRRVVSKLTREAGLRRSRVFWTAEETSKVVVVAVVVTAAMAVARKRKKKREWEEAMDLITKMEDNEGR